MANASPKRPTVKTSDSSAANIPADAVNGKDAQKVTPWDVEGAVVDGKQVR